LVRVVARAYEGFIANRDERLLIRFAHPGLKSWLGSRFASQSLDADTSSGSVTTLTHYQKNGARPCTSTNASLTKSP